jgi:hypothetical protein
MSVTITYADDLVLIPDLVLGYAWEHASRNVLHPLIANPLPAVTLREAAAKAGTLQLFFLLETAALQASEAHRLAEVFTYQDTDRPALTMRYVVPDAGKIGVTLDPETKKRWIVAVDYQQVAGVVIPG